MLTFVQVLDFIGTFAFAISGIRLASAKQFDWFGAYVVGLATAIGGGTIRIIYGIMRRRFFFLKTRTMLAKHIHKI